MALAILSRVTIECNIATPVFKHIIGQPMELSDLKFVDPQMFDSYNKLLNSPIAGSSLQPCH